MHACMNIHFASENEEITLSLSKFGCCHTSLFMFFVFSIFFQFTDRRRKKRSWPR